MTLDKHLEEFYKNNNIPINGGVNDKTFKFPVFGLNLTLPNPKFRREAIHIHDLQHVLNNCDTSWKGESFIAGWEISTGMWKYFPLGILSLWALGYSIWLYPKDAFLGYKKGSNCNGIIDLKKTRQEFLEMELNQLINLTTKNKEFRFGIKQSIGFVFWVLISQLILLAPILILLFSILLFV